MAVTDNRTSNWVTAENWAEIEQLQTANTQSQQQVQQLRQQVSDVIVTSSEYMVTNIMLIVHAAVSHEHRWGEGGAAPLGGEEGGGGADWGGAGQRRLGRGESCQISVVFEWLQNFSTRWSSPIIIVGNSHEKWQLLPRSATPTCCCS